MESLCSAFFSGLIFPAASSPDARPCCRAALPCSVHLTSRYFMFLEIIGYIHTNQFYQYGVAS
jgi:hypothetical protein